MDFRPCQEINSSSRRSRLDEKWVAALSTANSQRTDHTRAFLPTLRAEQRQRIQTPPQPSRQPERTQIFAGKAKKKSPIQNQGIKAACNMSAQGGEILGAITGEENMAATTSPLSLTTMATATRALDSEGEVDWEGDNGSDPANSGRTSNTGPTSTDDLWSVNPTTTSGGIAGAALTSGDRLFFGSADSTIRCLSTRNGSVLWKTTVGGAISSSPILLNSIIYVGSEDSSLYAINLETGALLWKTAPDQLPIYTAPVLIPPLGLDASVNVYSVLLTSGKNVRALAIQDAADESVLTGDELWRYSVPWNIAVGSGRTPLFLRSTPAVNIKSGRAFFCTGKRQSVVAINLSNGTLIWVRLPVTLIIYIFILFSPDSRHD